MAEDPDTEGEWATKVIWKRTDNHQLVSRAFALANPDITESMEVPLHATDIDPYGDD